MVKAAIQLKNGTKVEIEGTREEVRALLEFYGDQPHASSSKPPALAGKKASHRASSQSGSAKGEDAIIRIINLVSESDESGQIEKQILDRSSQVNRVLLPLYIQQKHKVEGPGLTSGDISRITKDLGIPISTPNVSRTLSDTARRYVAGDSVRARGRPVRYRITRAGMRYFESVVRSSSDAAKE